MTFFQHFLNAFREAKLRHTYDLLADSEFGWTEEDGLRLTEFFQGNTGQKLKARMTNHVCRAAVEASRQTSDFEHHGGIARGIALNVLFIEGHFIASPARSTDKSEASSLLSVAESLALN